MKKLMLVSRAVWTSAGLLIFCIHLNAHTKESQPDIQQSQPVEAPYIIAATQAQFSVYCYAGGSVTSNPLQLYSTLPFNEYTITWANRPPWIKLLAEVDNTQSGVWYSFTSPALTAYVDSCVLYGLPIPLSCKRKYQNGEFNQVWNFHSKETGPPYPQLYYNYETYAPPEHDARVWENHGNFCCDFLWVCDFTSPDSQAFYVQFPIIITGIEEGRRLDTRMLTATPNPFTDFTDISYNITQSDHIIISVYDIAGNHVKTLIDEPKSAGNYKVRWDGNGANEKPLPQGIYFVTLKAGSSTSTTKLLLLR